MVLSEENHFIKTGHVSRASGLFQYMHGSGLSHSSHVSLQPRTVACQAPLFLGFSKQEYWRGLPCPPPGDLPDPGIEPVSHDSCFGRQVLYHSSCLGNPYAVYFRAKLLKFSSVEVILSIDR